MWVVGREEAALASLLGPSWEVTQSWRIWGYQAPNRLFNSNERSALLQPELPAPAVPLVRTLGFLGAVFHTQTSREHAAVGWGSVRRRTGEGQEEE